MYRTVFVFALALTTICCQSGKGLTGKNKKFSKGIIVYHGDYFFLFKINNKRFSPKSVTWDYLYANIDRTGYALNGMHDAALDKLFDHFKGIALNVEHEGVKEEFKYMYVVPVNYYMQLLDTTKYNRYHGKTFSLHHVYKGVPYLDFGYKSYSLDTCNFTLWKEWTFSSEFNLTIDSMKTLIGELPPGIFKE